MITMTAQVQLPRELDGIRQQFQQGAAPVELLAVLAIIVLLVLSPYVLDSFVKGRRRREPDNPRRLFRRLIRRVGLDHRQQALLLEIAWKLRLRHPAALLASPTMFQTLSEQWLESIDGHSARRRGELEAIKGVLFRPTPLSTGMAGSASPRQPG